MSNELSRRYMGSKSLVEAIVRQSDNKYWHKSSLVWETYNGSNIVQYGIDLTEAPAGSNLYYADFPTEVTNNTRVQLLCFEVQGAAFATTDLDFPVGDSRILTWVGSLADDYSPSGSFTDLQKVRLNIGDTDDGNYLFIDAEINSFIEDADDDTFLASSYALRALAADAAKIAIIASEGDHKRDVRSIARELSRAADRFAAVSSDKSAWGIALADRPISTVEDIDY